MPRSRSHKGSSENYYGNPLQKLDSWITRKENKAEGLYQEAAGYVEERTKIFTDNFESISEELGGKNE